MTRPQVPRRNTIAFLLLGVLLVVAAAIYYIRTRTTFSGSILTVTLAAVLTGIIARGAADTLLRSRERLQILQRIDQRPNSGRLLFGRNRTDHLSLPRFFRLPPEVIDFQKRYVIRRPEVDAIISTLQRMRRGLQVIEGPPASGKSVLLYTLVFELGRPWWRHLIRRPVYFVGLKALNQGDLPQLKTDLENIPRRSVVFVDDVHLYPSSLGLIAQQFHRSKIVLVFVTRLLSNYPREQIASILNLRAVTYELSADSIANEIVFRFLSVKGLHEDAIAGAQRMYEPYKHDLWVLSIALEASDVAPLIPEISSTIIGQWVISRFLRLERHADQILDRATCLAAVAALYRFEVTASRDYLLGTIGARPQDLDYLVAIGDVLTTTDNFYALYHSSLADLIVEALCSEIGSGLVPSTLREKAAETGLLWPDAATLWQIETVKSRAVQTIVGVARASAAGREVALRILHQLNDDHFLDSIDSSVTDVETLGSFLALWGNAGRILTDKMKARLSHFLMQAPRQNVRSWSWLCYNVSKLDLAMAEPFVDVLAELVSKESASTIADIGTTMSYVSPPLAARALARSDHSAIVTALRADELPPEEVAKTFAKLVWVDPTFASAAGASLLEVFPESDARSLPTLLSRIAWGNQQVAQSLIDHCDLASLLQIVRDAPDAPSRYRTFASIANVSINCARELVNLGMTEWEGETGMRDLITRVLDTAASSGQVHSAKYSDSYDDSSLEASRKRLVDILRMKPQEPAFSKEEGNLREVCPPADLLLLVATLEPDVLPPGDKIVTAWLNELLLECGIQGDEKDSYLQCIGFEGNR